VMTGHVLSPKAFLTSGRWVDGLGKNKDAFVRATQDGSDYYSETTRADEKKLIETFKAKGVKFVEPAVSIDEMRQMTEPLKKQLPEVWTWAQRLSSK
jgi:TRAP-type C4-dicarboxylate transport system substrate-binding protein